MNTSLFSIDVIGVPLAAPRMRIVNQPRIFRRHGNIAAVAGGDHGPNTQHTSRTNQCHGITVYSEVARGGACSGNGILLDIKDRKIPSGSTSCSTGLCLQHSATFSDGTGLCLASGAYRPRADP